VAVRWPSRRGRGHHRRRRRRRRRRTWPCHWSVTLQLRAAERALLAQRARRMASRAAAGAE